MCNRPLGVAGRWAGCSGRRVRASWARGRAGGGQARDVLQALAPSSGSQFRGGCGTDLSVGRVGAGRRPSHQFLYSTLGDWTHFLSFEEGRRGKGREDWNGEAGTEGQPDKKYTSLSWKWGRERVQGLKRLER